MTSFVYSQPFRSITGFLICVLFLANPFARKNRCMWLSNR